MKRRTFERLAPLLDALRAHPALEEVRPATFDINGREFVHFHEKPEGVFADVLLAKGRIHMLVSTATEQAELLDRIDRVLESLEQRERSQQRRGANRQRFPD